MDTTPQNQRRMRRSRIRRGTVGGSIATFAAVWAVIFFQLVSGHDPVLSEQSQAQPAATASPSPSSIAEPSTTPAPLDAVTTRQS